MKEAVFESTRQALFVSFLVMSQEARQETPFRKALLQILSQQETLTKKQREWMDQLIGQASGTVNFSGLTGDEIRAQCAMVTQIVRDHLPVQEMNVILAKYIPAAEEEIGRDEEGKPVKRYYYSRERVDAVLALSEYWTWSRQFVAIPKLALDMMIARAFVNHTKMEISFRELAKNFGGNHMTYARAYPQIRARLRELENLACNRLTVLFEKTGLIETVGAAI